jgi:hypothetical protein
MPCINDTRRQQHKKLYPCNCTCPAYYDCQELAKWLAAAAVPTTVIGPKAKWVIENWQAPDYFGDDEDPKEARS